MSLALVVVSKPGIFFFLLVGGPLTIEGWLSVTNAMGGTGWERMCGMGVGLPFYCACKVLVCHSWTVVVVDPLLI